MNININETFSAVLTETGAAIWNNRYSKIRDLLVKVNALPAPVAAGDEIKFQLWDAMHVFGPHTTLASPEGPFKDCVVTYVKRE